MAARLLLAVLFAQQVACSTCGDSDKKPSRTGQSKPAERPVAAAATGEPARPAPSAQPAEEPEPPEKPVRPRSNVPPPDGPPVPMTPPPVEVPKEWVPKEAQKTAGEAKAQAEPAPWEQGGGFLPKPASGLLTRYVSELPASSAGAGSPEAAARAYVEGAAKGDMAAVKQVVISRADAERLIGGKATPEEKQEQLKTPAAALYHAAVTLRQPVEITSFQPGVVRDEGGGIVTMKGASLLLKRGDAAVTQRIRSILRLGDVWKIDEP